jgi:hypothetical protein
MAKYFLFWVFALIFLVQTPFIFSLDCNFVSSANYNTCINILNSNLTSQEKEVLISNLDYKNKFFPDHDYIFQRNTNIKIINPPTGVKTYNGQFVKDAWLSIFTTMPSIIYKDSLYVPDKTKVLSAFNYKTTIPQNYYSSYYPQNNQGDCKRIYTLIQNYSEKRIYVNNIYQGSGRLVEVNVNSDSEIKAQYQINVGYNIDHYRWEKYCAYRRNGKCVYSYRCSYNYNEIQQDSISIEDTLKVKHYSNNLIGEIKTIDSYSGNNRIRTNYSDSFYLNFNDSYFKYNKFTYDVNYSKEPYYVYTLRAYDYNQETSNNLLKNGNDLIVKNTNSCKIKAFDFFKVIDKNCTSQNSNISFNVETDKLTYDPNETIQVYIYPSSVSVNLSYGNQSKIAKGNSSFIANLQNNKVSADISDYHSEKIIFVEDKEKTNTIFSLSIFGILNYFFYFALKKCFGGII